MKNRELVLTLAILASAACAAREARAADSLAGQPFQIMVTMVIADGSRHGNVDFPVPDGKRLVIEHVSMLAFLPYQSGQNLTAGVLTVSGGQKTSHFIAPARNVGASLIGSPTPPVFDAFVSSHPARLYADPKTRVGFGVDRTGSATGQASIRFSISGRTLAP